MEASCPAPNLEDQFISLCLAPHSKSFQPLWPYQQFGCCCWHIFILLHVQVLPTRKYRSWNLRWTHPHCIYSSTGLSHQHKKLVLWIVVFRHWIVSQCWMDLYAFPSLYLWQRKGISEDSIRTTRFGMYIVLYISGFKMYFQRVQTGKFPWFSFQKFSGAKKLNIWAMITVRMFILNKICTFGDLYFQKLPSFSY